MAERANIGGVRRPARRATILAAAVVVIGAALVQPRLASAASASCPSGSAMVVVAHEDDSIFFMNPDVLHDIQAGWCVRTVFVTAGDDGQSQSYWSSREGGAEAAYAAMAGVPNTWTQSDAGIAGHPTPLMTLTGNPNVSIVFMRLPDGNGDGSGFSSDNFQSLQKLYTGKITQITAVDNSSSYTKSALTSALSSLMNGFAPGVIDTQDYVGTFGDGDHSDHHATAYFTRDAQASYNVEHTLIGYMDYATQSKPANVTDTDFTQKENAYFAYAPYDGAACQTPSACQQGTTWAWLAAQYTVGSQVGGPTAGFPVTANAGEDHTVLEGATTQLSGSGSTDPNGSPSYHWLQTGGPPVGLSSSAAVTPTFTAPASPAVLTFSLVVTDGQLTSQFSTVTITVVAPNSNVAPQATVTASSQDTADGSLAVKAVDGVIDGYPGDSTKEWATNGGGAGSWLKLVWRSPQTINMVTLYDRPNLDDQITGATLAFSDGHTVAVSPLNNDDSATTITFPSETTTSLVMTVNTTNSSTLNVGLAEIQVYPVAANAGLSVVSASPSSRVQGATNQNITITGSGFVNGATASFSNPGITVNSTTYVNATQLTANITIASTASIGSGNVSVTNPDGTAATATNAFTVDAPPSVNSTSPSALGQGTTNQNVTINGTGFLNGARVTFSNPGITVNSATVVTATQITANISIAANAAVGPADVTVTNPDAGIGTGTGVFTVTTAPTVSSVSPASADVGAISYNIAITGANFTAGPALAASFGAGITVNSTTYVDSGHLVANITIPAGTSTGTRAVTVTNGDGTNAAQTAPFVVNAAPTVTSVSPSSADVGATNYNVTIIGTSFESGASASFGSGITVNSTTYTSVTSLTANITIPAGAGTGVRTVSVANPDGSTASNSVFTVNAAPTVTSTSPSSADIGATNYNVTIIGTSFESGASASFGSGITVNSTTYTSATQLTASITITSSASIGPTSVAVTNPDGTAATRSGAFTINGPPTITFPTATAPERISSNKNATFSLTGTNFENGAKVSISGGFGPATVTFVSSTQLNVSVKANKNKGSYDLTLTNPDGSSVVSTGAMINQ